MLLVLPTHQGDVALLERLLLWMEALDGKLNHDCLLVFDRETPFDAATRCHAIASRLFREVRTTATEKSHKGWPLACNAMFHHAAKFVMEKWPQPFLLCEPDAVPLKRGWLDELDSAYNNTLSSLLLGLGKADFLGQIEACTQATLPPKIMSGVAIYPIDTASRIQPLPESKRAWQVDAAEIMVGQGSHTSLIKDFFGTKELPPEFVDAPEGTRTEKINQFTLDWLPPEAVLFHRDKTHSLIPLLAKKLNIVWRERKAEKIVVVLPVCHRDIQLAIAHAHWLRQICCWEHKCVIAFDPTCPIAMVTQLQQLLRPCFSSVDLFKYATPPINEYPQVANWCFQSVAHRMANQSAPWLFLEPDCVVLRSDWLDKLQEEYERAGKSWMGPIVQHMGHLQGTAIYPADAAHRMPRAMACGSGEAFDMAGNLDSIHDRHDASALMHHVWTILNGTLCPVGGGHLPVNATVELLNQIPRTAVFTHRWKDTSAINLLLSGAYKH